MSRKVNRSASPIILYCTVLCACFLLLTVNVLGEFVIKAEQDDWDERSLQVPQTIEEALEIYKIYSLDNIPTPINTGFEPQWIEGQYIPQIKGFSLVMQLQSSNPCKGVIESAQLVLYVNWNVQDVKDFGSLPFVYDYPNDSKLVYKVGEHHIQILFDSNRTCRKTHYYTTVIVP